MISCRPQEARQLMAALLTVVLLGGCTTLNSKHLDGVGYPFAGMRDTPGNFGCSLAWGPLGWLAIPFAIIDIPLSLIADILFLPADLHDKKTEPKSTRTCA
jgi:uncharacterized protein YceK